MEDFNQYQELPNKYLGSDRKKTLLIDGEKYLLKFPDLVRNKKHVLSYINNAKTIGKIIESIDCISEQRKVFYKDLIRIAFEQTLKPVYKAVSHVSNI